MKTIAIVLCLTTLSACATYNSVELMNKGDDATRDIARCGGGLGIDNRVGLIVKAEADKSGGELSASQSSEIFAKAMSEGLVASGDGKNYSSYVQCILELDKRRNDKASAEQAERLQQPALKVYLEPVERDALLRPISRLVVENTGEDLTELRVTPAPFLQLGDLCLVGGSSNCRDERVLQKLQKTFIPVEHYFVPISFRESYRGRVYSQEEAPQDALFDAVEKFTQTTQAKRTGSMLGQVITLVHLSYKDKFQVTHERFFDLSFEQREMPVELGQALFAMRRDWLKAGLTIDAAHVSPSVLQGSWDQTRRTRAELPAPWRQYLALQSDE